jgi:hypothetical protein
VLSGAMATEGSSPLRTRKPTTLSEFSARFLAFVKDSNRLATNTKEYYPEDWNAIKNQPIARMRIDRIAGQDADTIKDRRFTFKGEPITPNFTANAASRC